MPNQQIKFPTKSKSKSKQVVVYSAPPQKQTPSDLASALIKLERERSKPPKDAYYHIGKLAEQGSRYVGNNIGNFTKIFGVGAYKITKNNLFSATSNQVPFMHSSSETVVFRHREYIADISSSTAFSQTSYAVNPGLSSSFPYLSAIANNFQEYQFNGLVYEYRSTSANALNSTNTALGTVMMAAQYRADSASFLDKQQLMNEMWSVDSKPSESFILPIECSPLENPLKVQYVRGGAVPLGQDKKLYDLAKVTIATYGSQAAAVVGELWASYEVILRKPQITSSLDLYGLSSHFQLFTADGANTLGATRITLYNNIGLSCTSDTFTFPTGLNGAFLIVYVIYGTSQNGGGPPTVTLTNCVAAVNFAASGNPVASTQTGNAITQYLFNYSVLISDTTLAASVRFSSGAFPTNCAGDLIVTQVPYGFA